MHALGIPHNPGHIVYREALQALREADIPFLVGGAFGFESFTGIVRDTKDLDLFVRPSDSPRLLQCLADAGFRTELRFPHWLGKRRSSDPQPEQAAERRRCGTAMPGPRRRGR